MYQPLIKFHPYPAIITQVLAIFAYNPFNIKRMNADFDYLEINRGTTG